MYFESSATWIGLVAMAMLLLLPKWLPWLIFTRNPRP